MDNKIIDWEKLLDFNDEEASKNIEIYPLETIYEDKQFEIYKNDYNKLVSVESLLKSKSYYQTKYAIIAKHIISMDDYNVILQKINNETFEESILSKSIHLIDTQNISENENKEKNNESEIKKDLNELKLDESEIKKDLNELKLGYTKKQLEIFENEKMTGHEFEEFARRTLYLMILMIKRDNYMINNPKRASLNALNQFSKSKDKFTKDTCEIDVIINNFNKNDFEELISKFPNNFYFTEQLHLNEIDTKFNVIGEIARNLLFQSNKKKFQIKNYIDIYLNFKSIREQMIISNISNNDNNNNWDKNKITIKKKVKNENEKEKNKQIILKSFDLKDISNENIFILITNGPYLLFRIIFKILDELLKTDNHYNINDDIEKEINTQNDILSQLTESKRNIKEKVSHLYQIFKDLRKNKVNHCVLYIGTNSENIKDDEFFQNREIIKNKEKIEEFSENINEFKEIIKIKKGIRNMLKIKNEFEECYSSFAKNIYDKLIKDKTILEIIKLENTYKLTLNIYLTEDKKINSKSEYFKINKRVENINYEFLKKLITKNDKMELHLIIVPQNLIGKFSYYNNDNIIISTIEDLEFQNLYIRFIPMNGVYNRFFKKEFLEVYQKKFENLNSALSSISDISDISNLLNIYNNELKPEFIIEEESFKNSFQITNIGTAIDNNLILKIIDDIKKTTGNTIENSNLETTIKKNITKLEDKIKMNLFNSYFLNVILSMACKKSINDKFENINNENIIN